MEMESNLLNAYYEAYKIACQRLTLADAHLIAVNSGASYDTAGSSFTLKYLNRLYQINSNTGEVSFHKQSNGYTIRGGNIPEVSSKKDCEERKDCADNKDYADITLTVKVLMLHYLINASPSPLSGNVISFREIPNGCAVYYSTFYKRAVVPLLNTFSGNAGLLYKAAEKLGGKRDTFGHASVNIKIFPMVPVSYVLWDGDEEVAPAANILFDSSVASFLPGEDIVLAASYGVYELMREARKIMKLQEAL